MFFLYFDDICWQFKSVLITLALGYGSVFQPFCYSGTLRKCDNHSRNPMHW